MFVCVFLYSRLCLCECVSVCDVVPNNMGSSWFQGVMSPITLDHVTVMWLAERLSLSPIIRRRNGSALSFTKILPHGACVEDSGIMSGHWPLLFILQVIQIGLLVSWLNQSELLWEWLKSVTQLKFSTSNYKGIQI